MSVGGVSPAPASSLPRVHSKQQQNKPGSTEAACIPPSLPPALQLLPGLRPEERAVRRLAAADAAGRLALLDFAQVSGEWLGWWSRVLGRWGGREAG